MRILVALALLCGVAHAQPSTIAWRPPTGCTNGQGITYNTTTKRWQCATIGGGFTTNNVIPKGNGTGLTASSLSDDGGGFVTQAQVGNVAGFNVGDSVSLTGASDVGFRALAFSDGNVYFDHKTGVAGGTLIYRTGYNTESGDTRTWLSVNASNGEVSTYATTWLAKDTSGTSVQIGYPSGNTTAGQNNITLIPDASGDAYFETKVGASKNIYFTYGHGAQPAYTTVWMSMAGASGGVTIPNNLNANSNVTFGDATTDTHLIYGETQSIETVGATFGNDANLRLRDDTAFAAGVGGELQLFGKYNSGGSIAGVAIKGMKTNAVDGNYSFDMGFATYPNGGALTERARIASHGLMSVHTEGISAAQGLYHGSVRDIADTFISGFYRPDLSALFHSNWLSNSNTLSGGACADNIWCEAEYGSTIVYATSTQTSPRGVSETVGQLTSTGGTNTHWEYSGTEGGTGFGSIPYTDARGKTVTFSVWMKAASGTPTGAVYIQRHGGTDSVSSVCTLNSSTWTRCHVSTTLTNTSYADNSTIKVIVQPGVAGTAIYMWGAQLEESAGPTPYQAKTNFTNGSDGLISGFPLVPLWPVLDERYAWAQSMYFATEPTGYGGSADPHVSIQGSTGSVFADVVGVRESFAVSGNSTLTNTTFLNGPAGINTYDGTHLEWVDEFMGGYSGITSNGLSYGETGYYIQSTGLVDSAAGLTGRPGVMAMSTSTAATNVVRFQTGSASVTFADGAWTYEAVVSVPDLSTAVQEYSLLIGFVDVQGINQIDGCYFVYDRGNTLTAPGTGDANTSGNIDKWKIWSANNSTRSGYALDGTATEDSFTGINSAIIAATFYRLKVVEEATKCRFYIDGIEVGRLTTNLPTGARQTGAGFAITKSAGTTARNLYVDATRLAVDLITAR